MRAVAPPSRTPNISRMIAESMIFFSQIIAKSGRQEWSEREAPCGRADTECQRERKTSGAQRGNRVIQGRTRNIPISRPPIAGPVIVATSNMLEFHDAALLKISSGTIRGRKAFLAGMVKARSPQCEQATVEHND